MTGSKAVALDAWAAEASLACTRFDYRGHGASPGAFTDGTIGGWRDDALHVLDRATAGPMIVVGSSMGGWIALLLAMARPERVRGLVLVAPATDFTEELIWNRMPEPARATLLRDGIWRRASAYSDEPDEITRALVEEGRNHLLLGGAIPFAGPVRILHGMADATVPWELATRTAAALTSADIVVTLVKNGDHRLSDPANLARLEDAVRDVARLTAVP